MSNNCKAIITSVEKLRYEIYFNNKFEFIEKSLKNLVVGDILTINCEDGKMKINNCQPRKNYLIRLDPDPHENKTQVIASNFDYVFCVVSMNKNFNINRICRLLILVKQSKAYPFVILTKCDLVNTYDYYIKELKKINCDYIITSCVTNEGIEQIKSLLSKDKTFLFIGSSGVGKSSLINKILNKDLMKTSSIRAKDDRGRHTTTIRKIRQELEV